jgi:Zn-dependent protease with chaperone function
LGTSLRPISAESKELKPEAQLQFAIAASSNALGPLAALGLAASVAKELVSPSSEAEDALEAWISPDRLQDLGEFVSVGNTGSSPALATAERVFLHPAALSGYSSDALEFLIAHEVSHLRNRDSVAKLGEATLLSALDQSHSMSHIPGGTAAMKRLAAEFDEASQLLSRQREGRADLEAVEILQERGLSPERSLRAVDEVFSSLPDRPHQNSTHPPKDERREAILKRLFPYE